MTSTTWCDNSPFQLVPCSPYIGTTVSSISPAPRAVPDIGETAETSVADSPKSVAGQDVPQTPVFHEPRRPSSILTPRCITPHCLHIAPRAATPEQEVPKTPLKKETLAKKQASSVKLKSNSTATEINLFHGKDDDIFG